MLHLDLVASDPETAPSRFVASDAPLPPSAREPVHVMSFDEWDAIGRPNQISV